MMDRVAVGSQLRAARLVSKWRKMASVASAIGVTTAMVGRYERGMSTISADLLFSMCDLYGISVDSLRNPPEGVVDTADSAGIAFGMNP